MELFKKFTETIFYKKDSQLEEQISALKELQQEYPNNSKLNYKLKLCELGLIGENEIEFELKNANIGMYILHDVNLKYKDLTAQIDYIIITPGYTYFVECKNLIGNISVNNRGEFIREYIYNHKKIVEGIYSPIRQAERHIEIFKKLLDENQIGIMYNLLKKVRQSWFKPLVVLANSKNILKLQYAPKEIKSQIVRSDSLIDYIKKDINNLDKDYLSSQKYMNDLAFKIMQNYNQDIEKDYKEDFQKWLEKDKVDPLSSNANNEDIKNKLINYRKTKSQEKNIPTYYIFTNEELNLLLTHLPKTYQELEKSNILSNIKLKLHGQEIINIINNL